jgi:hypothetical protein
MDLHPKAIEIVHADRRSGAGKIPLVGPPLLPGNDPGVVQCAKDQPVVTAGQSFDFGLHGATFRTGEGPWTHFVLHEPVTDAKYHVRDRSHRPCDRLAVGESLRALRALLVQALTHAPADAEHAHKRNPSLVAALGRRHTEMVVKGTVETVAYDISANVVFLGGGEVDPPPPLGTAERTRYVKVKTLEQAQGSEMHTWIEQARHVPGWK